MDTRFRSPVVPRKIAGAEEASANAAVKKSKRSKSTVRAQLGLC